MLPHVRNPAARSLVRAGRRHRLVGIAALCAVFGLLIWAKLQLVAQVPRTVLADPDRATPTPPAQVHAGDPGDPLP